MRANKELQQKKDKPTIRYKIEGYKGSNSKNISIHFSKLAEKLWKELDEKNIINQIKSVPQLGLVNVPLNRKKYKYDYIAIQLYLHEFISKSNKKTKDIIKLKYSYSSNVKNIGGVSNVQMIDLIEILTISYSIGHFYNTFTSSMAMLMDEKNINILKDYFKNDVRTCEAIDIIVADDRFDRLHLINSLAVLKQCKQSRECIKLAKELILKYIENNPDEDEHIKFAFEQYRKVRTVAYMYMDLSIADIPLKLDILKEKNKMVLFKEYLSRYNDKENIDNLVVGVNKFLNGQLYNNNNNVICNYYRSKYISKRIVEDLKNSKDYYDFFTNESSVINVKPKVYSGHDDNNYLKLVFCEDELSQAKELFKKLDKKRCVRTGYFYRYSGNGREMVIIASITRKCSNKRKTSFEVMRFALSTLMDISMNNDRRIIASVKFFLYYLFDENSFEIKPSVSKDDCAFLCRGLKKKTNILKDIVQKATKDGVNKNVVHEAEAMCSYLNKDKRIDSAAFIPASIIINDKNDPAINYCEIDGIVVHYNRSQEQIAFIEAKNGTGSDAKNDLKLKINKLGIKFKDSNYQQIGKDGIYRHTVK